MKTIILLSAFLGSSALAQTPTFNKEVSRIFQQKCQTCHRPGGLAPFALADYADAKRKAVGIDRAVTNRTMPPWPPNAGCGEFRADRSLSQQEITTIRDWVAGGAPEGDPADLPNPINFSTDWALGIPDQILSAERTFKVPAHGHDIYRCFVLPYEAVQDGYIKGFEIKPDNVSVVHHAIIYLDPKGDSLALLNPNDPQPGYTCFGGAGFDKAKIIGGWAPGSMPELLPEFVGISFPKGARLVMQIHYHAHGHEGEDQTELGVHFAKDIVTKPLQLGAVYDMQNLIIPAGEANYKISKELELTADVELVNVFPHMHLLGKEISLEAILPDNSRQCLIQINKWNFNWQGFYSYRNFIPLPKGTKLKLNGVYDNSANNPNNPNRPPIEVRWGEQTTDEMFLSFFSFILK